MTQRRITNSELYEDLSQIKLDLRDIKIRLLDPDSGVTARVNMDYIFNRSFSILH